MSGIAIIIQNANYSGRGKGTVTPIIPAVTESISIIGNGEVTGINEQYNVVYTPAYAQDKGVKWSIVYGSEFASIDEFTGLLTLKSGASSSTITIRATLIANETIYNDKTILGTYDDGVTWYVKRSEHDKDLYINSSVTEQTWVTRVSYTDKEITGNTNNGHEVMNAIAGKPINHIEVYISGSTTIGLGYIDGNSGSFTRMVTLANSNTDAGFYSFDFTEFTVPEGSYLCFEKMTGNITRRGARNLTDIYNGYSYGSTPNPFNFNSSFSDDSYVMFDIGYKAQ